MVDKSCALQMARVAVVTGSNRGLGLATVRDLLLHPDLAGATVYLTARREEQGLAALATLAKEVGEEAADRLRFHTLDITEDSSVAALTEHLRAAHGGIDVLVHNAGLAFPNASTVPFPEQARRTLDTNFWGTRRAARALQPLLRPGARVVFVSSNCGHLSKISGAEPAAAALRRQMAATTLTDAALCCLVEAFMEAAAAGSHVAQGWPDSAYKVGKSHVWQWPNSITPKTASVNVS